MAAMRLVARLVGLCLLTALLPAGPSVAADKVAAPTDARSWLARMHAAASTRNYEGTMLFSAGGTMSSSQVAHFCVGNQVYERIEALDGKQRRVYRHNDTVHTIWPQAGVAVVERRSLPNRLPSVTQSVDPRVLEQYELRLEGRDRVAGREAQVFVLQPRDELRFAQRIWADEETGLMLRSDVLGDEQVVLESARFTSVEIGVRAQPDTVLQPLKRLDGLRVLRPTQVPTRLEAEGWTLTRPVQGFQLTSCVKRPATPEPAAPGKPPPTEVLQVVFSDGLTHVSLFIEPIDESRHRKALRAQFGATHSLAGRKGDHWITAMGDVPPSTLKLFVDALDRRP
jgi:sigma-E factor negative regulatory protein RseB